MMLSLGTAIIDYSPNIPSFLLFDTHRLFIRVPSSHLNPVT